MTMLLRRILKAVVAVLAFCWALLTHAAVTVTDDRGVTVTLPAVPQRVVSLLPSLTETVCALGACDKVVGADRYSNYPAPIRKVPKTGGLDDANVELVTSLKPDVVLVAISSRVTGRLEALGLKVVALEPRTHADVKRVVDKLARMLGREAQGEQLWQGIEADIAAAARAVPNQARSMRVYYEVDSAPYAAGESSFIGQTLKRLGLKNVVPRELGPFPRVNPEFIVRADPDIIMVSARHAGSMAARPGWADIQAVKHHRVCMFNPDEGDVLSRPGPRMGDAAAIMAACVRNAMGAASP